MLAGHCRLRAQVCTESHGCSTYCALNGGLSFFSSCSTRKISHCKWEVSVESPKDVLKSPASPAIAGLRSSYFECVLGVRS